MRVLQRLDYALRTLVMLARQPEGSFMPAGQLAERLGLPRRFVEQQVTELARAGIVHCRRGASGGCALVRDPAAITARDVVVALQGDVIDVPRRADSAVAALWQGMAAATEAYLASVTLAELVSMQRELDAQRATMYYI